MSTEPLETLILGPEDRLVVVLPEGLTMAEIDEFRASNPDWNKRVLFIVGPAELAVLREPTAPGSVVGPCGEVNTVRPVGGGMVDYRCHLAANHAGEHFAQAMDGSTLQWPELAVRYFAPTP